MQELVLLAKNIALFLAWIMAGILCIAVSVEFIKNFFENNK